MRRRRLLLLGMLLRMMLLLLLLLLLLSIMGMRRWLLLLLLLRRTVWCRLFGSLAIVVGVHQAPEIHGDEFRDLAMGRRGRVSGRLMESRDLPG